MHGRDGWSASVRRFQHESGTDSKAGGPDYLLLFTQAKSIAEKIGVASPEAEQESDRMGI